METKPDKKFFWIAGLCIVAMLLSIPKWEIYYIFMFGVFALISFVAAMVPAWTGNKYQKLVVNGSTYFIGVTGKGAVLRSWEASPKEGVAVKLIMTNSYESAMGVDLLQGQGCLIVDWPGAKGIVFDHKLEVAKMIPDDQGRLILLPQQSYLINPNGNEISILNYLG